MRTLRSCRVINDVGLERHSRKSGNPVFSIGGAFMGSRLRWSDVPILAILLVGEL